MNTKRDHVQTSTVHVGQTSTLFLDVQNTFLRFNAEHTTWNKHLHGKINYKKIKSKLQIINSMKKLSKTKGIHG